MKIMYLLSVFLLISNLGSADVFRAEMSIPKTDFIRGEPVIPTGIVSNVSGKTVKVVLGENGFRSFFLVERIDRNARTGCQPPIITYTDPREIHIVAQWNETKTDDVRCGDEVGSFRIRFVVTSTITQTDGTPDVWVGSVESPPFFYTISEPQGIDKQAFSDLRGAPLAESNRGLLLQKYPTSLYAAYAVFQSLDRYAIDPETALSQMEEGYYLNASRPDETGQSPTGWRSLFAEETVAWHQKWFNIIRTNHPNIWFEPFLKLREALDQLAIKQYDLAAANLRALAKDQQSKTGKTAQRYLALIKQKRINHRIRNAAISERKDSEFTNPATMQSLYKFPNV